MENDETRTETKVNIERDKRTKKEMNRLTALLKNEELDTRTLKALESAIANLAFMSVVLEDLREDINANGYVEHYQNGPNQFGTKDSAALKAYNTLLKSYNATLMTLKSFIPYKSIKNAKSNNELAAFLMKK